MFVLFGFISLWFLIGLVNAIIFTYLNVKLTLPDEKPSLMIQTADDFAICVAIGPISLGAWVICILENSIRFIPNWWDGICISFTEFLKPIYNLVKSISTKE